MDKWFIKETMTLIDLKIDIINLNCIGDYNHNIYLKYFQFFEAYID